MTPGEPIDLIHIEGEGKDEALDGEFIIETLFVRGSARTWVFAHDLQAWRDALDAYERLDLVWKTWN